MPDNRIGYSFFAGTGLARKTADWEQIQRWNAIRRIAWDIYNSKPEKLR